MCCQNSATELGAGVATRLKLSLSNTSPAECQKHLDATFSERGYKTQMSGGICENQKCSNLMIVYVLLFYKFIDLSMCLQDEFKRCMKGTAIGYVTARS